MIFSPFSVTPSAPVRADVPPEPEDLDWPTKPMSSDTMPTLALYSFLDHDQSRSALDERRPDRSLFRRWLGVYTHPVSPEHWAKDKKKWARTQIYVRLSLLPLLCLPATIFFASGLSKQLTDIFWVVWFSTHLKGAAAVYVAPAPWALLLTILATIASLTFFGKLRSYVQKRRAWLVPSLDDCPRFLEAAWSTDVPILQGDLECAVDRPAN